MKHLTRQFASLVLFAVLAPAAAAAILTVGPSGQYAEIADALAAAQPGDVILVEPGIYGAIDVDKAVRIIATGTGTVQIDAQGGVGVRVSGIPAGSEAVLSGLEVRSNAITAPIKSTIVAANNAGTVVLHDLVVVPQFSQVHLWVEDCARLVLQGVVVPSGGVATTLKPASHAVRVINSELWIVNSTVRGGANPNGFALVGNDAVAITDGVLRVWRSSLEGADAAFGKGIGVVPHGGDGVRATNSEVVLYGGAPGEVLGGDGTFAGFFSSGAGGAALVLDAGSTASVQANVVLEGGFDGFGALQSPAVIADASSGSVIDPFLYPTLGAPTPQVAPGDALAIPIDGHSGGVALLFGAFDSGPSLALSGIAGLTFLSPTLFVQAGSAALGPAGSSTIGVQLPPLPELVGAVLHFQALELSIAGLAFTNPTLTAVR